ncbi:hypothetical protein GCM10010327_39770 [Streptomyces nitrosporeus]|nr:hypothetical protein GCM10010327_39770 [Streptomyces nitrosporeus]
MARSRWRRVERGRRDPGSGLGFLRGRVRPAVETLVAFIDAHRQVSAPGLVCRALTSHGPKTATSSYYAAENRTPQYPAGP